MKIQDFKIKPQLVEITLDSIDLVEKYGEPITFHMYDHIDLTSYFKFFKAQGEADATVLNELIKNIILNDKGKPVIDVEHELPIDIFAASVVAVAEHLGKSVTKNSTSVETGTQP
jgi:hypothetical protein